MSFTINVQALRDRASKRAATIATVATQLPAQGSKVAALAGVAGVAAPSRATVVPVSNAPTPQMTRDEADRAHWPAWSGAEIDRTVSRVHLFMRRGVTADHAEHMAERLLLRDRDQDDRYLCLECSNLTPSGRCYAAARGHLVGIDPRMEPVPTILMRCEAFTEMIPS